MTSAPPCGSRLPREGHVYAARTNKMCGLEYDKNCGQVRKKETLEENLQLFHVLLHLSLIPQYFIGILHDKFRKSSPDLRTGMEMMHSFYIFLYLYLLVKAL